MKNSIRFTALFFVLLTFITAVQAKLLDRILVIVNEDVITEQQLETRLALIKNQYRSNPSVLPRDEVLREQLTENLILESLQLQLAEQANVLIPEQAIDEQLVALAQRQNLTLSQYIDLLDSQGQSIDTVRSQVQREMLMNRIQQQMVGRRVYVSDAEVERFLSTQSGQSLQDVTYQLAYQRFETADQTTAEARLAELNAGGSLLDLPGSQDLGARQLADIPSIFKTLVPVLSMNEAVLLERNGALHLAQLISKSEQQSLNVEEYRIRHILIQSDIVFDDNAAQQLIQDLRQRILNGENMATLADEYTHDDGTKGRGGDLDFQTLNRFVPAFADTATSLDIGELSDVVQTQFGYHILRVEEVRTQDVGLDVLRNQIRTSLQNQRYQEALQTWFTELRAESFVEFRN